MPTEKPRPRRDQAPSELSPDRVEFQKMPQHFDIAAHRQFFHREPGIEALRPIFGPPMPTTCSPGIFLRSAAIR